MSPTNLERNLKSLTDGLLVMASMVEQSIHSAVEALKTRNMELAEKVIKDDDYIDHKCVELEEACIEIIATQQPMAVDLRVLVSVLTIIVELERMGDYAEGIAKINIRMGDDSLLKPLVDIPRMADKSTDMLRRSISAFLSRDADAARQIIKDDDEVDSLYDQVFRELLTFMIEDPRSIQKATYLIWAAHDLERIADRATNIAERVVFTVTGKKEDVGASHYS
ncbi:MAG: phosphate transport system regulatory protein PhoU [Dehalococcoidia bacterium]|nr:phosphate transport system regulatory protein PhoU [Dehalococcoidia bacterium]|tara:strand:+ start:167 stop:835 length:669 start_codon:yes stop_codon:yes gene_type:complete